MQIIFDIAAGVGALSSIFAFLMLLVKPVRNHILGINKQQEGNKCLLRAQMLGTYYRNHERKTIRQYEFENFMYMYEAYKALGGNSFIDKIKMEVESWEVIT